MIGKANEEIQLHATFISR